MIRVLIFLTLLSIGGWLIYMALGMFLNPGVPTANISPGEAAQIKELTNQLIQPQHHPITNSEWDVVCRNYERSEWDYSSTLDLIEEEHGRDYNRPYALHKEFFAAIVELMEPPKIRYPYRALVKGFCRTEG